MVNGFRPTALNSMFLERQNGSKVSSAMKVFSDLMSSLCTVLPVSLVDTEAEPPRDPPLVTEKLAATWLLNTVIPIVLRITF